MKVVKRHLWNSWGRRIGASNKRAGANKAHLNVEGVESRQLLAVFTVTTAADGLPANATSLREAINSANANPGPDTIEFAIPGNGVQVLQLDPAFGVLPTITDDATTINGYSQPGASRNTLAVGDDANILIQIDGSLLPANPNSSGLILNSSNNDISGLSITNFGGNVANRFGIVIAGDNTVATGNHIHGNFIGLNPNGVTEQGNTLGIGIRATFPALGGVVGFADNNIIGVNPGSALTPEAQRNIIVGANDRPGISAAVQISAAAAVVGTADNNLVAGNYIGTDASGNASNAALSNIYGVRIQLGAANNTIGGANATDRNVIGGVPVTGASNTVGVLIEDNGTSNNSVIGNFFGVQANGNPGGLSLNTGIGINGLLNNAASIQNTIIQNNRINQTAGDGIFIFGVNAGNTDIIGNEIIGSGDDGISIVGNSPGNQISANVIFGSGANGGGGLGIDLGDDGVSPNDALDADSGENNIQNFPVIASAVTNGVNSRITGSLTSTPNTTFNIEFFANDAPNASGFGEGQRIINTIQVTTDAGGVANFQFDLAPGDIAVGSFISATATDTTTLDTSEFAAAVLVQREILVSIDDVVITEPDDGGVAFATFTVTANSPLHSGFQVNFDTPDFVGAAPAGYAFGTNSVDFNGQGGTLFFAPGQTRGTIAIPINGDSVAELDELFQVTLRDATSNTGLEVITIVEDPDVVPPVVPLTEVVGQGLILDNDASFTINDVQVAEGGNLVFTVTLNGPTSRALSVDFAVADGSANAGSDFTPLASGTLNFPIGTTTQTVTVATLGDTLVEGPETLFVNLSNPQYDTTLPVLAAPFNQPPVVPVVDAKLGKGQGVGTIMDLDSPLPIASISDIIVAENVAGGLATFTVTLSTANNDPIVLTYSTTNGSALSGQDYTATVGTLNIPAGSTSATFTVPINDDALFETDENFFVNLAFQSGNVILSNTQAQATIVDNESTANVRVIVEPIASPVAEPSAGGTANLSFRIRLVDQNGNPAVTALPVQVNFFTGAAGDTATAGTDYTPLAGTLTFAPGQNVQIVNVPVLADNVFEAPENLTLTASTVVNGIVQTASAQGVITDRTDGNISVSDVVVNENAGTATFTVVLAQPVNAPTVVSFSTQDGTALAGSDYTPRVGTVTIPAGSTTATFTVPIINDNSQEPVESFFVNLAVLSGNGSLVNNQVQATIVDDDQNVRVIIEPINATVKEPGVATFQIRLVDDAGNPINSATPVQVNFRSGAAGDTAIAGLDYVPVSGTLTFAPGENSQVISVPVLQDNLFEGPETFTIQLINAVNGTLLNSAAIGTIIDNTAPAFVTDFQRLGFHRSPTAFVIRFNNPIDPAAVANLNNYHLATAGRDGRLGTGDDKPFRIANAFLADSRTLVIVPAKQVPLHSRAILVINGLEPDGLRDTNGNLIDGDRDGLPGGNYVTTFNPGGLRDLRRGALLGQVPVAPRPFGNPPKVRANAIKAAKALKA